MFDKLSATDKPCAGEGVGFQHAVNERNHTIAICPQNAKVIGFPQIEVSHDSSSIVVKQPRDCHAISKVSSHWLQITQRQMNSLWQTSRVAADRKTGLPNSSLARHFSQGLKPIAKEFLFLWTGKARGRYMPPRSTSDSACCRSFGFGDGSRVRIATILSSWPQSRRRGSRAANAERSISAS